MKEVHDHSFNVTAATAIGHEKAILLKEIYYWCQQNFNNKRNFHHGLYWTYNTAEAFVLKFPYFSRRSIARWLQQLEQDGYIGSLLLNKKGYDRTKWYCVNEEAYVSICEGSKPGSLDYFKKYITNLATSIGQTSGQDGQSNGQNGQPIPPLNPSPNQSPFIEPQNENELLVTTKEEIEGMEVTGYELLPNNLDKDGDYIPAMASLTPPPNSATPHSPKKHRKPKEQVYKIFPPTLEEVIPLMYEKLVEKKRVHTNIVDCWNWANHQSEKFLLYHEEKGWKFERLKGAIATWVNGAIGYGTVTKPCPIQYKNNPETQQPARPTKVHVEQERPVLTQHDIEYSQAAANEINEMFKNMGVRV